jgi:hypothetical protein
MSSKESTALLSVDPRRRRLLIGPEKKKGYYGFFLEKSWTWSRRRRRRAATGNIHLQAGSTEGSHRIPPHPWFPNPAEVEARAQAAGEAAFMAISETELSRRDRKDQLPNIPWLPES